MKQVFPQGVTDPDGNEVNRAGGMTLREHFAGLAMQGLVTGANLYTMRNGNVGPLFAEPAVILADALIEALEKPVESRKD